MASAYSSVPHRARPRRHGSPPLSGTKAAEWQRSPLAVCGAVASLLLFVASWVALGEVLQYLQSPSKASGRRAYDHPLFVVVFSKAWWTVGFLIWLAARQKGAVAARERSVAKWAALASAVVVLVSVLWTASLSRTSVGANTAVYNASTAVVFVLSVVVLGERATAPKAFSVVLSVGGVVAVALAGSSEPETGVRHTVGGIVLVAAAMVLNSAYQVAFKRKAAELADVPPQGSPLLLPPPPFMSPLPVDDFAPLQPAPQPSANAARLSSVADSALVLGATGLCVLVGWSWSLLLVSHAAGLETFAWPDRDQAHLLLYAGALDAVMNASVLACIALTTPLFLSMGSLLTIPASIVVDYALHDFLPSPLGYCGVALVFAGFALLYLGDRRDLKVGDKAAPPPHHAMGHVAGVYVTI